MGSQAHVVVVGGPRTLPEQARRRIEDYERRWSRFLPGSELSRLNAGTGRMHRVSDATWILLQHLVAAWEGTDGRFDPTVLDALRSAGYRNCFEPDNPQSVVGDLPDVDRPDRDRPDGDLPDGDLPGREPTDVEGGPAGAAPGCAAILFDPPARSVLLPRGVRIDAGGLGKGLAADLVVGELLASGAEGAMVNLGGDLRAAGNAGADAGWVVGIDNPFLADEESCRVAFAAGAVATSSRLRRTWHTGGKRHHHLIDPATGRSSLSGLAGVTVIAAEAWWAEAVAKAAFLAGPIDGGDVVTKAGATGVLTGDDGTRQVLRGMAELLV